MNDYDYKSTRLLINEIIDNSFQALKRVIIKVEILKSDSFMASTFYFYPIPWAKIQISKSDLKKMSHSALVGLIAHELCHIEDDIKNNIKSYLSLFKNTETERRVDLMVIEKGYGSNLLDLLKYHNSYYKKYNKEDGLTKREIEKLIKKPVE